MAPLTVGFRTDASLDIGTGHVMRCLTLAEALRTRGARCRFFCREHPGNLNDAIRRRGFELCVFPASGDRQPIGLEADLPAHSAWLGAAWEADAEEVLIELRKSPLDWLVVDHYALDSRWERAVRSACDRLMVIDDIADRQHDCNVLLDQNLGRARADYAHLVSPLATVLAGPQFALLRPEFAALRASSLARRASASFHRLLVTMGGVDKDNVTSAVLSALTECPLPDDCRITVVMGPHAPWLEHVRDCASRMPWSTDVLVNVSDMAQLMADSDFAIGAAGSTSWERCSLGLATALIVLADNQEAIARALESVGAAQRINISSLKEDLRELFTRIKTDPLLLFQTGERAAKVTDGRGAELVVNALFEYRQQ